MDISFEDFKKLDIRIGKVEDAQQIPNSRNLIKLIIDFGSEKRQCVAGILNYYNPKELVNKKFAFLMNLQRRKLMGVESQCMILAAEDKAGNVILVTTERDISSGSRIL